MKVLIAIDSFKGSLSSLKASEAITKGIKEVDPNMETVALPLADGGEGTVEALVAATNGSIITTTVTGPLGGSVEANYGILGNQNTAVIEVAEACGLPLVPISHRNPAITTTYGVGELISDAVNKGCRDFIIGLGGSATNDAGVGMLQALGYRFLDEDYQEIGYGGIELMKLRHIDSSKVRPDLKESSFRIACDVHNPLYGPNGAAYVFGPQKGASSEMVEELDQGLKHFAAIVHKETGINFQHIAGAGAAGGLGAAFAGFLNSNMQSGIDLVLQVIRLAEQLKDVDLVITGEGKLDGQTSMGKAPVGVAAKASEQGIPVIALAGGTTKEAEVLNTLGVTSYFSIVNGPVSLEEAMRPENAYYNLKTSASQLLRLIKAFY